MLFCTDLDGTLYSSDKTVSKQNLDAIEYFKSEGGLFTFITGRTPATSKSIYDIVKPNAPYGCNNGGGIYDGEAKKYLFYATLPPDVIELVRQVDKHLPGIAFEHDTQDGACFNKYNPAMLRYKEITGSPDNFCHFEKVKKPAEKIVFTDDDEEQILLLAELLNSHPKANSFNFIRSERSLYEILPKEASKGNALCKMAELFNIKIENTIAVGDYNNDISMVRAAGIGFAVANAVKEVKDVADYITVSNNEHAIAAIIEGLDKGTYKLK